MPTKLSEIAIKMAKSILHKKDASPEAVSIALQIFHIAWNYADEDYKDEPGYIQGIEEINALMSPIRREFITDDAESLIGRLMEYKQKHYKNDTRTIFSCEYKNGSVRVAGR